MARLRDLSRLPPTPRSCTPRCLHLVRVAWGTAERRDLAILSAHGVPRVRQTRQKRRNRDFAAPHAASCAAPPPRRAAVARPRVRRARSDVGTSQTCAHAARIRAGNTPESPEVEVVGGEGRSGCTHKVARNRYVQLARITRSGARSTTSSVRPWDVELCPPQVLVAGRLCRPVTGVSSGLTCRPTGRSGRGIPDEC